MTLSARNIGLKIIIKINKYKKVNKSTKIKRIKKFFKIPPLN